MDMDMDSAGGSQRETRRAEAEGDAKYGLLAGVGKGRVRLFLGSLGLFLVANILVGVRSK